MKEIETLISLGPNDDLIVSCYLARAPGRDPVGPAFDERVEQLRQLHDPATRESLDAAVLQIRSYLEQPLQDDTRGIAAFARAGDLPFFLARQFQVPVPEHVSAGTVPDVYHLVELKDSYDRYVVLTASAHGVRILEVNLGAVTRDLWCAQPELRVRVDDKWAHAHYQHHHDDHGERFLDDKLRLLEKLMTAGGHSHLIVAGDPLRTAPILERLPPHLRIKLVEVVPMSAGGSPAEVVAKTLATFVAAEQQESRAAVTDLIHALWRDGLAVAGVHQSLDAIWRRQADVLVLSRELAAGPAWACHDCDWVETTQQPPDQCPECDATALRSADRREALVRLAERRDVEIEIVQHSDELTRIGGVGCLLRYRLDDEWPVGEP